MGQVYAYETRADMMLMDGNNHMRNSAYLDIATASRYRYFEDEGFGQERLMMEQPTAYLKPPHPFLP